METDFFLIPNVLQKKIFVKNFGNPCATVNFNRQRLFIEEGEDKISIKFQTHRKIRGVGSKYFSERKSTNYFTFNFKKKMFYSGTFSTKKRKLLEVV